MGGRAARRARRRPTRSGSRCVRRGALHAGSAIVEMTMALAAVGSAVLTALLLRQLGLLGLHFKLEFRQPGTASGAAACVVVLLG